METTILRLNWVKLGQSIHWRQRILISKLHLLHILLETVVNGYGNIPEGERVRSDVIKHRLLLVLDGLLKGTDRLCTCNLDQKDSAGIITMNETVKFENRMI